MQKVRLALPLLTLALAVSAGAARAQHDFTGPNGHEECKAYYRAQFHKCAKQHGEDYCYPELHNAIIMCNQTRSLWGQKCISRCKGCKITCK